MTTNPWVDPLSNKIAPLAANPSPSATDSLSAEQWRQHIAKQCPDLALSSWWLLGTSGCHLCEVAKSRLKQLQAVTPVTYQWLDIVRLTDTDMAAFATQIPVLLTPNAQLNYPFSVLDLQRLVS